MRVVFLASKQPANAVAKWAASLQTSGTSVKHLTAWAGAGELGRRQNSSACNVDSFLLGHGASLESHLARYCCTDGLLLVSLEPWPKSVPRAGVVLLVWQPQVPQDIVNACAQLLPCLVDGGSIRGILLVDPSPSLTLSVTHKALEGAGLHALARKATVLVPRTSQAPQAAVQALLQFAENLYSVPAPPQPGLPAVQGGVRIAVARDEAFGPCFHENLTVLHQNGGQLSFFSLLYDAALPAGATCLYLSSGPLEPERWQQLAANRPLVLAIRAFCEAGGLVLAEGAGMLYLARSVDLSEDEDGNKHCRYDMAGVLPFETRLLSEAQTAAVEILVTDGNPLMTAGSRPRGYLSEQARIVMVEERQLQSLVRSGGSGFSKGKATVQGLSTTYEVTVVAQPAKSRAASVTHVGEDDPVATLSMSVEGYTLHNVLASSCLLFLPSDPTLATHWLRSCASLDPAALAASMARQLGGSMTVFTGAPSSGKMHYQSTLGSAACSRVGSRRQSIQEVSTLAAAYASNGSISAGSSCGMLTGLIGCGAHPNSQHHNPTYMHQQQNHHYLHVPVTQCHQPQLLVSMLPSPSSVGQPQGGSCVGNDCSGTCEHGARTNLTQSNSGTGMSVLGLDSRSRHSLCGPESDLLMEGGGLPQHDVGASFMHSRSPHFLTRSGKHPCHPTYASVPSHYRITETPELPYQEFSVAKREEGQKQLQTTIYDVHQTISSSSMTSGFVTQDAALRKLDSADSAHVTAVTGQHFNPSSPPWGARTASGDLIGWGGAVVCTAMEREEEPRANCKTNLPTSESIVDGQKVMQPAVIVCSSEGCGTVCSNCILPDIHDCQCEHHGRLEEPSPSIAPPVILGYPGAGWVPAVSAVGTPGGAIGPQSWSAGLVPAGARQGSLMTVGAHGPTVAASHGGVMCSAPGACEALVAMGLANRLAGIGSDCDYPPDVCASRRVVFNWVPPGEAPQGTAARGIRVVMPRGHGGVAGAAPGGPLSTVLGGIDTGRTCCSGRTSAERSVGRSGRALIVDELALRREPPSVVVLPDLGELWDGELAQLEQGLQEADMLNLSGRASSSCCLMCTNCRRLVDVMDMMLELGTAMNEPHAASILLERLQARIRRVMAAAAMGLPVPPVHPVSPIANVTPVAAKCPRVLVLRSLQPLVEPGRWVPEMLALAGATSCLAQPGGPDVELSWQDIKERAAPDVIIILNPQGAGSAGGGGGVNQDPARDLQDQLAALPAQPGWWCLPAVRVSQVYLMHSSYCLRPGPRLVDGVELFARLLMPGQYNSNRKVPPGALMRLSLAAGQRCRATLLPSYFVSMTFS